MPDFNLTRESLNTITDVEIAFGTTKLLPSYDAVPEEFKRGNDYTKLLEHLFFGVIRIWWWNDPKEKASCLRPCWLEVVSARAFARSTFGTARVGHPVESPALESHSGRRILGSIRRSLHRCHRAF